MRSTRPLATLTVVYLAAFAGCAGPRYYFAPMQATPLAPVGVLGATFAIPLGQDAPDDVPGSSRHRCCGRPEFAHGIDHDFFKRAVRRAASRSGSRRRYTDRPDHGGSACLAARVPTSATAGSAAARSAGTVGMGRCQRRPWRSRSRAPCCGGETSTSSMG